MSRTCALFSLWADNQRHIGCVLTIPMYGIGVCEQEIREEFALKSSVTPNENTHNVVFVTSHKRDCLDCERNDISPVNFPHIGGRDTAVGIAIRYGLDAPGIEPRWRVRFSAPLQTGRVAHPSSCTMDRRPLSRGKNGRPWRLPPTPSGAEVKLRVELYLYSSSGSLLPIIGKLYFFYCTLLRAQMYLRSF
jgi:hypothetical protein